MKKIITILLIILLLCSCGGRNRDYYEYGEVPPDGWDIPPEKLFSSAINEEGIITLTAENNSEEDVSHNLRFRFQKQEGDSWILIEPLSKEETVMEFVLESGKAKEISFDLEDMFGRLENGKYRIVVTSLYDGEYRNQWYEHYVFETDNHAAEDEINVTAKAENCDNIDINATVTNESEKEVFLREYNELFIEKENGFEKFETIRGINFGDSKTKILPGESVKVFDRTSRSHGVRPIGRYRMDLYIEFEENGRTVEQKVSFEFEVTGFEESNIVPVFEKSAELSGNIIKTTFRNEWGYKVCYGEDYFIQKADGENWITVEPINEPAFDDVLYETDETGAETAEWSADLNLIYGELPKGSYRLVKPVFADTENYTGGKHYVFFEFEKK